MESSGRSSSSPGSILTDMTTEAWVDASMKRRTPDLGVLIAASPLDLMPLLSDPVGLLVALVWDSRPLSGLAGLCDWRLNGRLSLLRAQGRFVASPGETTLVGASRRLEGRGLLLFGLGSTTVLDGSRARFLGETLGRVVLSMGGATCAVEVPRCTAKPDLPGLLVGEAFRMMLTASTRRPLERLILIGPETCVPAVRAILEDSMALPVEAPPTSEPSASTTSYPGPGTKRSRRRRSRSR
jgi:hypothetical protein